MRPLKTTFQVLIPLAGLVAAGCAEEPQPRSTQEFLDNPQILEAVMVRCSQNRSETRYDVECMNARSAVSIIEAREERERRAQLEAESENKRDALRRTQRAAEAAQRRAEEARRLREEAEYLAQFGETPPAELESEPGAFQSNVPGAVIPEAQPEAPTSETLDYEETVVFEDPVRETVEPEPEAAASPAAQGSNAPVATTEPDLDAVREELERRNQSDDDES